jgi:hypothetical protein
VSACGGGSTDVEPTLRFSERSDAEIARLISAAGGTDMFGAQANVESFQNEEDPCPAVAFSGNEVTLTGGCTTADGVTVGGSVRIVNPLGWDPVEYDFGNDTEYVLEGFVLTRTGFEQSWDGFVRIQSNFTAWDADVTASSLGVTVRSDLHYECSQTTCDLSGSGIELVGVGGAIVEGEVAVGGGTANAEYTLEGADTLEATVSQGCVTWSIDDGPDQMSGACP